MTNADTMTAELRLVAITQPVVSADPSRNFCSRISDGMSSAESPALSGFGATPEESRKQLFANLKKSGLKGTVRFERTEPSVPQPTPDDLLTDKQYDYLKSLMEELGTWVGDVPNVVKAYSRKEASAAIDSLREAVLKRRGERKAEYKPKVTYENPAPSWRPTEGMYKVGDRIVKVQRALNGDGHVYAKELIGIEKRNGKMKHSFKFVPGLMRILSAEAKMTLEQAKEFGALYGTCCVCGRTLTNEESIAAGIGPVCAEKGGF